VSAWLGYHAGTSSDRAVHGGVRVGDEHSKHRRSVRPAWPSVEGQQDGVADADLGVTDAAVLERQACELLAVEGGSNEVE
jgi:hypothetical protein